VAQSGHVDHGKNHSPYRVRLLAVTKSKLIISSASDVSIRFDGCILDEDNRFSLSEHQTCASAPQAQSCSSHLLTLTRFVTCPYSLHCALRPTYPFRQIKPLSALELCLCVGRWIAMGRLTKCIFHDAGWYRHPPQLVQDVSDTRQRHFLGTPLRCCPFYERDSARRSV
jgi:hypothetical protein